LSDVVRVTYYLLDAQEFRDCWPLLRQSFGQIRPAATMLVVAGLADPGMRIEIEVTARIKAGRTA
jgi:enamine deaminase RidA (YjgF/YER057c/UK114 family)